MLSELDKKYCSKHKLEILTIDLKQSTADEDKYLCIKCLMEKVDIENMALVEETKIMIKQMKSEQFNSKIKECQRRIENFRQIQISIKELKLLINNTLDKVQCNLNQKITILENELQESEPNTQGSSFEEDVTALSKNYKGSFSFDVPKKTQSIDDNSYIDSIQQQFQSIVKCPIFNQINKSLEDTKVEESHKEIKQLQLFPKKEENPQKTPSLNIQCNKHGKEIIMFNLNPEKTKLSRFACVECIQSNDPIKYTTLSEANFRWNEYLGQTSDQVKQFQNQRCLKSRQIIEILEEIKEKYNSTISDMINRVNTQYSMFSQNKTNEFNENIIYEMSTEQINELTEILSQADKFQVLTQKQFNIEQEDLNLLEIICSNFEKLLQNNLLVTNKFTNIFKEQNFNITDLKDSNKEIFQQEIHLNSNQSIKQLNFQLQHLSLYQDILNEAQNQYELILDTISKLQSEFKDLQLQQFNQYVSKFEKDFSIMKKLTYFDKIEAELKQHKQDKQLLQNHLSECEQINLIELEQQKTQFQVILQEKQRELERLQHSNQKNEEIVKQLQETLQVGQFCQSLTFSTTYKHSSCSVTQNGRVIENTSGEWYCCMCDQMIPKNGVIQFAYKIIENTYTMIGIGFRDIVQSKGYSYCYSIGGGTYNIYSSSHCYNHDQPDKNDKLIAFPFSTNDIIIVEVDIQKKYVKWTKQSTNQSFVYISNYYYLFLDSDY